LKIQYRKRSGSSLGLDNLRGDERSSGATSRRREIQREGEIRDNNLQCSGSVFNHRCLNTHGPEAAELDLRPMPRPSTGLFLTHRNSEAQPRWYWYIACSHLEHSGE
jgi:hypothetical protein